MERINLFLLPFPSNASFSLKNPLFCLTIRHSRNDLIVISYSGIQDKYDMGNTIWRFDDGYLRQGVKKKRSERTDDESEFF